MSAIRSFRGVWGEVHELAPLPPREGMPEQEATLQHWFLLAPPAHPLWPHYLFFVVHLRDVEGQSKPPFRRYGDSSHELMLIALNPKLGPWTAENVTAKMLAAREESAFLSPPNYAQQLRGITDAQACQLTALLARGLITGVVPIERDDWGGRARWEEVIASTLEHITTGGHAR